METAIWGSGFRLTRGWNWSTTLGLVCVLMWLAALFHVRTRFGRLPGWAGVLARFHVAAFCCTLGFPTLVLAHLGHWQNRIWAPFLGVLCVPAFLFGIRCYFYARRQLRAMQREQAVRMVQERLSRKLRRGGSG